MSPWGVRFRWGAVTPNCSDQAQGYVELQDYVEMQGYASCDVAKLRWNAKCRNEAQGDNELFRWGAKLWWIAAALKSYIELHDFEV